MIDRSGITNKLRDLFIEAQSIKSNILDKLAPQYKLKNPKFYRRYKAARTVSYRNNTTNGKGIEANESFIHS